GRNPAHARLAAGGGTADFLLHGLRREPAAQRDRADAGATAEEIHGRDTAVDRARGLALRAHHQPDQHRGRAAVRRGAGAAGLQPVRGAAVGHDGGTAQLRALCRAPDRHGGDAAGRLHHLRRTLAGAAAGRGLPGAAHHRRAAGAAHRAGPAHGGGATDPDPGADGVRLAVGHRRPAAGRAAAGLREAGAGADRRHGGLGTAAGMSGPGAGGYNAAVTFPVRAITLDLDDTLWPFAPIGVRIEHVLDEWMRQHSPATARMFPIERMRALRQQVWREHPQLAHDMGAMRRLTLQVALRRSGADAGLLDAAYEAFYAERNRVEFYPDAREALARIAARVPVVALSNGNADL